MPPVFEPPAFDQLTRDVGARAAPLAGISQRVPPHNLEAEQALLGAILTNNRAYERVAEYLAPEHFADAVHGRIFEAAGRRIGRGQIADAVTLRGDLANDPVLEEVGGAAYLGQLIAASVTIVNANDYGRAIFDSYLRRQLIDVGEEVVNSAFAPTDGMDGEAQIEAAEQRLFDLATQGVGERSVIGFVKAAQLAVEAANNAFRRTGHVSGLATGLADLDAKLGGLHPSDLVILAGRPGMGKSALATCMAVGAARAQLADVERGASEKAKSIVIFSLEMSAEQLATRILSDRASVSSDRIRRGAIEHAEFEKFYRASVDLQHLPLAIDDTPALSMAAMRTRARRLARGSGLALIVVDYLQLMRPAPGRQPESRVLEISQITQGLKALAKELNVPVLALAQLSRAVEQREDKRPQLSDLRESGTIEQDADVVMFVYRDEYYLEQRRPKQAAFDNAEKFGEAERKWQESMDSVHNKAEVIIGKQRHGPTGTVPLFFEGEFTRFANLDQMHAEDGRH